MGKTIAIIILSIIALACIIPVLKFIIDFIIGFVKGCHEEKRLCFLFSRFSHISCIISNIYLRYNLSC
jgi:hemerythrin-like domain-containing protein